MPWSSRAAARLYWPSLIPRRPTSPVAPPSFFGGLMDLRHSVKLLLAAVLCSTSLTAGAAGDDIPPATAAAIRATLHERIPDLQVQGLHKSPLPGLYELDTGQELIYTNEDASILIAGRLIDTKTRSDLTAQRWDTLTAIDFNSLPFDA